MPTYLAFLRAVNVGKRAYPMVELRACLQAAGFDGVETHIQTGNVRLASPLRSRAQLETALEKEFRADRGFDVPTVVLTPAELVSVVADAEELDQERAPAYAHYVSLLKSTPTAAGRARIEDAASDAERVFVRGRAVHQLYDIPYHRAKTGNAAVEKALGPATNRNLTVLRALAQKWA